MQTLTASDGSFILEGLPTGMHNLVVYSLDGSFQPFQQGAVIAPDSTTPAMIQVNPNTTVNVTFLVSPPENNLKGIPIRIGGTSGQDGTSASVDSELALLYRRMLGLSIPIAGLVKNQIWSVDKLIPVTKLRPMIDVMSASLAAQRFNMTLMLIFAGVALALAAIGIYGVMSYSVAQRTREIGVRIALGARRADVLQMTVKQGLKLVGAGMLLGLAAAFILTRVMASLLYGISATDPITFAGISLMLLAVAILASYVPALRATRVDPIIALRAQ